MLLMGKRIQRNVTEDTHAAAGQRLLELEIGHISVVYVKHNLTARRLELLGYIAVSDSILRVITETCGKKDNSSSDFSFSG